MVNGEWKERRFARHYFCSLFPTTHCSAFRILL
jgi:hypothetical protein